MRADQLGDTQLLRFGIIANFWFVLIKDQLDVMLASHQLLINRRDRVGDIQ